jgi:hypothetical protein
VDEQPRGATRMLTLDERAWWRFEAQVDWPSNITACWKWNAHTASTRGYGSFFIQGKRHAAHRVAYQIFCGGIPEGLHLDHLCRIHNCVNPLHLEPVTPKENLFRGLLSPLTRTHCKNGHEYTADNTAVGMGRGGRTFRRCLTCSIENNRKSQDQRMRKRGRGPLWRDPARMVGCPSCLAPPGDECRHPGGGRAKTHIGRRILVGAS